MASRRSMVLCTTLTLHGRRAISPFLRIEALNLCQTPVRCGSSAIPDIVEDVQKRKVSRAMKVYLENARAYDKFIKEEEEQFELGKKHLANIMGMKAQEMTQEDIDKAIEYLLPSGLFKPGARPMMKPPHVLHKARKAAEFDLTGRPYHYLFFTMSPNYSAALHEAAVTFNRINDKYLEMLKNGDKLPEDTSSAETKKWKEIKEVRDLFLEKITTVEYNYLKKTLERLDNHPCGYLCQDFIIKFRKSVMTRDQHYNVIVTKTEDGRTQARIENCKRKTAIGWVEVIHPGTGIIDINGQGIDYFEYIPSRVQNIGINWVHLDDVHTDNDKDNDDDDGNMKLNIATSMIVLF